jgi:rhodanese-related sulfurtransferase
MNWKRLFVETAALVLAAVLCATVANLLAARERKVAFVGSYPNALTVPPAPDVAAPPADAGPSASTSTTTTTSTTTSAPDTGSTTTTAPVAAAAAASSTHAPDAPRDVVPRAAERASVPARPAASTPAPPAASSSAPAAASAPNLLARFPPHKDKPFVEISGEDAMLLAKSGALVIDARRPSVYEEGHVAGARSMAVWESDVDQKVTELVGEGRDTQQPVVLYCAGGECEDSHMLAQKLWGAGFENLLVYKDGFPDWQKRGGAVHRGAQP